LRNENKVKRSERVEVIAYLKWEMRSSIGRSPIISKLDMRELDVPIPQTYSPYPLIR